MTIQRPYNLSLKDRVIDGNLDYRLSWKTSGDTSASFAISIYNNADNTLAWNLPRTYSYALSYTIPAGSIPNGIECKVSVQVWNASEETATSQFEIFTTSSVPTITVPPIGTVGNHSYLFSATYSQAESDPISTYTINLYNENRVLLGTSGVKTDGLVEYRFDLMKNGFRYFVEFIVTSKKGLTANSGLIEFTVVYENPSMYFELDAIPVPEKASVKLHWSVRQVIGKTTVEPIYLESSKLDVRTGKVFFDEGFEINGDFTLKIWFENLSPNTDLIYINGSNGDIRLQYSTGDTGFYLHKVVNGRRYNYFYSIDSTINKTYLCVQQKNARMDMYGEVYL